MSHQAETGSAVPSWSIMPIGTGESTQGVVVSPRVMVIFWGFPNDFDGDLSNNNCWSNEIQVVRNWDKTVGWSAWGGLENIEETSSNQHPNTPNDLWMGCFRDYNSSFQLEFEDVWGVIKNYDGDEWKPHVPCILAILLTWVCLKIEDTPIFPD